MTTERSIIEGYRKNESDHMYDDEERSRLRSIVTGADEGQQDIVPDNTPSSFRSREEVEEFVDDLCKKFDLKYERIR